MRANLGSGADYRNGWVNVDVGECKKDVYHDLDDLPLPFKDSVFEYILMQHSLEHLKKENFVNFMRELWRIGKPDATIHIESPYYLSVNAFTDFQHQLFLTERSFGYFCRNGGDLRDLANIYGCNDFEFEQSVRLDNDRLHPGCNLIVDLRILK